MTDSKEASASHSVNVASQEVTALRSESRPQRRRNNWNSGVFRASVTLLEIIGIICVCLVSVWTANYMGAQGFAWSYDPYRQFKFHPLFMVIGLVFLYGNAIIVYRMLADASKMTLKVTHAVLHGGAFIFAVIALVAVFQYHYDLGYPDLYSIHSWIGLVTVILFALQYAIGFIAYLLPFATAEWRARLMPFHTFFGLLIFVAAIGACVTGINEKLVYEGTYANLDKGSVIGNCLGILLIVFSALVVFVATSSRFKRMPLPEETSLGRAYSPQQEQNKADRTSL